MESSQQAKDAPDRHACRALSVGKANNRVLGHPMDSDMSASWTSTAERTDTMDAEEILRDSSDWYLLSPNPISERVLEFALSNSGKKVLDIGCAVGEY